MSTTDSDAIEAAPLDAELERFTQICDRLGQASDHLHAEWVDGYLTALAVTWRKVPIEEVLPLMTEGAFAQAFAEEEDAAAARDVLAARLKDIRDSLDPEALLDDSDTMRLAPLMQIWDDETREDVRQQGLMDEADLGTLQTGADWARGFLSATVDFAEDWPSAEDLRLDDESAELLDQLQETVAALAMDPASEDFQRFAKAGWQDGQPTRDELINEACFAIQDLRLWWLDHAPRHAPRRVEVQPGRNDPCHCGSGKKFKKCHGA